MSQIHGFSSAMKFIIFFLCVPLVYSEFHNLYTVYTGINEQTFAGIPEFFAETTLDGQQIDYYDNNIKKMIPKQNWMKKFKLTEMWKEDTKIRKHVQQIYKNNIHVIMERFNHSGGVHTYHRAYGCAWDDKIGVSFGFDRYSYDGKEFITLDVSENRYTAHVPQAIPTVEKWNNDNERFTVLRQYYNYECVYWLKHLLSLKNAGFKRTDTSEANLETSKPALVMSVISVMCLFTVLVIGFAVWFKLKRSGFKPVSCSEECIVIDKGE